MRSASALLALLVTCASMEFTIDVARAQRDTSGISGDPPRRSRSEEKPAASTDDPAAFHILMSHSKLEWTALRFNQRTGEAWTPNREHDPDWIWEKTGENTEVPSGDYELQSVCYTLDDGPKKISIRLDRSSGKSWVLSQGAWYAVVEPPDFFNATTSAASFRLIVNSLPKAAEAVRFNSETGTAWTLTNRDQVVAWQKVAETAEPPKSDYDLQSVVFVSSNGVSSGRHTRMDRKTGRTWGQSSGRWSELEEPEGFAGLPAPASGFRLVMNASTNLCYLYRYNPETGATWVARAQDGKGAWYAIAEGDLPRPGDYDVQVVGWLSENGSEHYVIRMDRKTGWLWIGSEDQRWQAVSERPDIRSSFIPASGFRLVTTNSEKSWYALRFNPESGETWVPNQDGDDWYADRWVDNPALPKSKYDVQMTSFIDGDDGTENVYRTDLQSGRCWNFNQKWLPVPFSPPDAPDQPAPPTGFQLTLCPSPYACNPFRFNPTNGDTWAVTAEQPLLWVKTADAQPLPIDRYQFNSISYLGKDNATFDVVLRINSRTGQAWYSNGQQWMVITEPN